MCEEQLLKLFEAPVGDKDGAFTHGAVLHGPPDISWVIPNNLNL